MELENVIFALAPARSRLLRTNLSKAYPHLRRHRRLRLERTTRRRMVQGLWAALNPRDRLAVPCSLELPPGGVILLAAHLGPFEAVIRAATRRVGRSVVVVGRPLPRVLGGWIHGARRRAGVQTCLDRGALLHLPAKLADGAVVIMALDQHTPGGLRVPFYGRPAATSRGVAWLAHRTGAPVIPAETFFARGHHLLRLGAPIPVEDSIDASTQRYAEAVEAMIRRHPTQWWWTHRRVKDSQIDRSLPSRA